MRRHTWLPYAQYRAVLSSQPRPMRLHPSTATRPVTHLTIQVPCEGPVACDEPTGDQEGVAQGRGLTAPYAEPHFSQQWTHAALYDGMLAASRMTGDARYRDAMQRMFEHFDWKLIDTRFSHADDEALGRAYLELYQEHPAPERIDATRALLDRLIARTDDPGRSCGGGATRCSWRPQCLHACRRSQGIASIWTTWIKSGGSPSRNGRRLGQGSGADTAPIRLWSALNGRLLDGQLSTVTPYARWEPQE